MILRYEDEACLVVEKPEGMDSVSGRGFSQDQTNEVKTYLAASCPCGREPYAGPIGRLDKAVRGLLLFAKTPALTARLEKDREEGRLRKSYLALVSGRLSLPKEGEVFEDMLLRLPSLNRSYTAGREYADAKEARLLAWEAEGEIPPYLASYRKEEEVTLLRILLDTGRHHQIRVQLSSRGHAILGDSFYEGGTEFSPQRQEERRPQPRKIALFADALSFCSPATKQRVRIRAGELPPLSEEEWKRIETYHF